MKRAALVLAAVPLTALAAFGVWLGIQYWLGGRDDVYMGEPEDYMRPEMRGKG